MDFETLGFDISDGVCRITFQRPDAANALNRQMALDLMHAAIECDENADVLAGSGKILCAGERA